METIRHEEKIIEVCATCGVQFEQAQSTQIYCTYKCRKRASSKKHKSKLRKFVSDLKDQKPCVDCGVCFPAHCLDFDHKGNLEKIDSIAGLVSNGRSLDTIKKEIEKCELRCVFCHRLKTAQRAENPLLDFSF